jgi:biotin operon repressor
MNIVSFVLPDGRELCAPISSLVIAGWAGRNRAAVEHHIEELEAIGVARPSTVPLYYRVAADQLTTSAEVEVLGPESSGEAEVMLLALGDELFVGLGSDHTDRKVESYSVAVSKQLCIKPVARELWLFDDVEKHWDELQLRSWATVSGERVLYQEGSVASLLNPRDLIARHSGSATLVSGTAMFCGTLPAMGGIRPSERFEMELHDPVLNRTIRHTYNTHILPMVA